MAPEQQLNDPIVPRVNVRPTDPKLMDRKGENSWLLTYKAITCHSSPPGREPAAAYSRDCDSDSGLGNKLRIKRWVLFEPPDKDGIGVSSLGLGGLGFVCVT